MAVMEDLQDSRLRLVFYVGDNPDTGRPIFKYKNFSNIKLGATPEQLYETATAIASLQADSLEAIERHDMTELYDD